jgi:type VI protein secretion system component Hcp
MTRTDKQRATASQRQRQATDKATLSDTQLDAVSGGDGATTSLYKACATGKHIPTGTITV